MKNLKNIQTKSQQELVSILKQTLSEFENYKKTTQRIITKKNNQVAALKLQNRNLQISVDGIQDKINKLVSSLDG